MFIATSTDGIAINYQCRCLKYTMGLFRPKCPDEYTDKCYKCKYCRADISASDVTRLIDIFRKYKSERFTQISLISCAECVKRDKCEFYDTQGDNGYCRYGKDKNGRLNPQIQNKLKGDNNDYT